MKERNFYNGQIEKIEDEKEEIRRKYETEIFALNDTMRKMEGALNKRDLDGFKKEQDKVKIYDLEESVKGLIQENCELKKMVELTNSKLKVKKIFENFRLLS
jgi:hypothetical protein